MYLIVHAGVKQYLIKQCGIPCELNDLIADVDSMQFSYFIGQAYFYID